MCGSGLVKGFCEMDDEGVCMLDDEGVLCDDGIQTKAKMLTFFFSLRKLKGQ